MEKTHGEVSRKRPSQGRALVPLPSGSEHRACYPFEKNNGVEWESHRSEDGASDGKHNTGIKKSQHEHN